MSGAGVWRAGQNFVKKLLATVRRIFAGVRRRARRQPRPKYTDFKNFSRWRVQNKSLFLDSTSTPCAACARSQISFENMIFLNQLGQKFGLKFMMFRWLPNFIINFILRFSTIPQTRQTTVRFMSEIKNSVIFSKVTLTSAWLPLKISQLGLDFDFDFRSSTSELRSWLVFSVNLTSTRVCTLSLQKHNFDCI